MINDIVVYWILPFVLVFVLVFAILQKSKVLGEDKTQIDALISLVIGAMFVAVPGPHVEFAINMIPWTAVALVVMLVFFLLYGFVNGKVETVPDWMQWGFLILTVLFILGLLYYLTPISGLLGNFVSGSGETFFTIVIFIIAGLAIYWAVKGNGE